MTKDEFINQYGTETVKYEIKFDKVVALLKGEEVKKATKKTAEKKETTKKETTKKTTTKKTTKKEEK